jgi:hypothetical protein
VFKTPRLGESGANIPVLSRILPPAASGVAICVSLLVLAGWSLNVELLKRVVPGFVAMNSTTAVCFVLTGFALALSTPRKRFPVLTRLAIALSAAVLLIGTVKIFGLAAGWHPNVDEWLFASKLPAAETTMPNRMAPNTAFNFVLIGLSLLTLDVSGRRFSPSQPLVILAGFAALVPITGYIYGLQSFRGLASFIPMACIPQ